MNLKINKTPKSNARRSGASRSVQTVKQRDLAAAVMKTAARLLLVSVVTIAGLGLYKAYPYINPDIQQVVVKGDMIRLDQSALSHAVYENLRGGILTLDIEYLQFEISKIAWVESVEIVKHFPSTLEVHIVEEQAVVQWNNQGYISNTGEFIESRLYKDLQALPLLSSAVENLEPELGARQSVEIFHMLNSTVLMSGQNIRELRQSPAGGWMMVWDNGLSIDLGRTDHLNRTRHAMAAWQRLPSDIKNSIDRIDARYENGVAIRTRSDEMTETASEPSIHKRHFNNKQHLNALAQLI